MEYLELALSRLSEENREWIQGAIPDALAFRFASSPEVFVCADFQRPICESDLALYAPAAAQQIHATFVINRDWRSNAFSQLATRNFVGSYRKKLGVLEGSLHHFPRATPIGTMCHDIFTDFDRTACPQTRLILLLSFEKVDKDVVRTVQQLSGSVLLVQMEDGTHDTSLNTNDYDMRLPMSRLQQILAALVAFREQYQAAMREVSLVA
ncbi:hypothetical protein ASD00_27260 [Ensifer sp. Root31]|uniref:hypothetical protein n=1 Tax=Ensifer sp. Root31 TaxID=1736512 RepID=UPI00070D6D06|nr:hypothetical protein [Ensifer sp. Root31]KQU89540.1 hypothetical protein ASD00_27260 [Ensifer sp. Root31]